MLTRASQEKYNKVGINFVTFTTIFSEDFINVVKTINNIVDLNNLTKFDFCVIDDGSNKIDSKNIEKFCADNYHSINYIRNETTQGVGNAITQASHLSNKQFTIAIPGHNMFDIYSITKVMDAISNHRAVLGYRDNLFSARPIIKFLSSKLLTLTFNILTWGSLKDVNGLNLYYTHDILRFSSPNSGHGNHIQIMKHLVRSDEEIIQVPILININHNKRSSKKVSDNFPRLKNVIEVIKALILNQ